MDGIERQVILVFSAIGIFLIGFAVGTFFGFRAGLEALAKEIERKMP